MAGTGGGCAWDVNTPVPKERIGVGAAIPSDVAVEFRSSVSTSALDTLECVLRWVEKENPLLLRVLDATDVLRERDCLGEMVGVADGEAT